ncbi:DUF4136 domain-containing protein [Shewanella sp. GXUN23E]|uniref:DUF4136 domain-containing protein n=1 Tax=Shewanella sp. GXUN23E TaxID=3422498 RepID=UPI003D7E8D91
MKNLMLLAVALMLGACSSVNTNWDYNPAVDFAQFKTFAWATSVNDESEYHLDGLMDARVRKAIDDQLVLKGLTEAPQDKAQLLVNYLTKVDTKVDVDTFTNYYGYNPYYPYYGPGWGWGGQWGQTQTQVREYNVGTLIVDLVDAKTKALVWRGSIADIIRDKKTPQERTEFINKAVADIMANYPPKPQQ